MTTTTSLSGIVTNPPADLREYLEALHRPTQSFVDVLEWRWLALPDTLDLYTEKRPYIQPIIDASEVSYVQVEDQLTIGALRSVHMDLYEVGNRPFYAGLLDQESGLVAFWSSPQIG